MGIATWVKILGQSVCISHSANTLEKCINSTIPTPNMGKSEDRVGL